MAKLNFKGNLRNGNTMISVDITLYEWSENDVHFIYSPALDLTGYGKSQKEARNSFEFILKEYVSYTSNKSTLFDDLEKQGWMVNRRKKRVHAPEIEDLMNDNEDFKTILLKGAQRTSSNIELNLA